MFNHSNPIVITGMGTVSVHGTDDAALWQDISNGEAQYSELSEIALGKPVRGIRIQEWNYEPLIGKRGLQFLHACSKYVMGSSLIALANAGLNLEDVVPEELGIVVGTNFSGMRMAALYDEILMTEGPNYVSPMEGPNTIVNSPASYLAIKINARACNTTITTGANSGFDALGNAATLLRKGAAKYVVVGGVEELNDSVIWFYDKAGLLPSERYEEAGLPFHPDSSGWMPAEGAASVVLERKSDALARGATILAELVSWSSSFSAVDTADKRADGIKRSMLGALQKGGIPLDQVGLVLTGASGLPEQDQAEAMAVDACFENYEVPVSAIKGVIGELNGASGIFQVFAAVRSLQTNTIPATVGPHSLSGEAAQLNTSQEARIGLTRSSDKVLLTSQDLFGASSAVVVGRV